MKHMQMTETQAQQSVAGARADTAISLAIREANRLAEKGGINYTVVATKNFGICVYNDLQLKVKQSEIIEQIFSTDNGFIFQAAA